MNSISRCIIRKQKSAFLRFSTVNDSESNENKPQNWRKTFEEKGAWTSKFRLFAPKREGGTPLLSGLRHIDFRPVAIRRWWLDLLEVKDIAEQSFIKERHDILGNDLATAHFILYRGGKVKFSHEDEWHFGKEHNLPRKYTPGYRLEAVDASDTPLRYEGLLNFVDLKHLKRLSLKNCVHVDDWFLDYISGEIPTLEYLDLKNCQNITNKGLACLYRLQQLKYLNVTGIPQTKEFEFTCFLLKDIHPGLKIEGLICTVE